jgi:regulator of protease activity HflC (stomatin/prohibitin superfamily)
MEGALSWIGQIMEAMLQFVPQRVIVKATDRGVRWSWRGDVSEMKPGLRWYWPFTTEIEIVTVARQPINTPTQALETKDGHQVVAGGVIIYHINDVVKAIGKENWSPEATASDITQAAIVHVVSKWDHDELVKNISGKVEKQLTEKCRQDLRKYGVYPARVALTDYSSARNLNHSGIRLEITGE